MDGALTPKETTTPIKINCIRIAELDHMDKDYKPFPELYTHVAKQQQEMLTKSLPASPTAPILMRGSLDLFHKLFNCHSKSCCSKILTAKFDISKHTSRYVYVRLPTKINVVKIDGLFVLTSYRHLSSVQDPGVSAVLNRFCNDKDSDRIEYFMIQRC